MRPLPRIAWDRESVRLMCRLCSPWVGPFILLTWLYVWFRIFRAVLFGW